MNNDLFRVQEQPGSVEETLGWGDWSPHFFDVGEHFLSILQVHARLQELLGRQLDIADLFAYSTVEVLAEFLEADMPEEWPGIQRSRNRAISRQAALARRTRAIKDEHLALSQSGVIK